MVHKENIIFKFAPITSYTYKNLLLSQLWFGSPDSMNDQLEGMIKFKNAYFEPSELALDNFIKENDLGRYFWDIKMKIKEEGFNSAFFDFWYYVKRNQFIVSCFSKTGKEHLMWSHYSDKHKGICLMYEKYELIRGLRDSSSKFEFIDINYEQHPIVDFYELDGKIHFRTNESLLSTKDLKWSYEDEIRLIANFENSESNNGYAYSIYHSALKGIIYGSRIDDDDLDSISFILRNDPLYSHVVEYRAQIDFFSGGIKIVEI